MEGGLTSTGFDLIGSSMGSHFQTNEGLFDGHLWVSTCTLQFYLLQSMSCMQIQYRGNKNGHYVLDICRASIGLNPMGPFLCRELNYQEFNVKCIAIKV